MFQLISIQFSLNFNHSYLTLLSTRNLGSHRHMSGFPNLANSNSTTLSEM